MNPEPDNEPQAPTGKARQTTLSTAGEVVNPDKKKLGDVMKELKLIRTEIAEASQRLKAKLDEVTADMTALRIQQQHWRLE